MIIIRCTKIETFPGIVPTYPKQIAIPFRLFNTRIFPILSCFSVCYACLYSIFFVLPHFLYPIPKAHADEMQEQASKLTWIQYIYVDVYSVALSFHIKKLQVSY